MDLTKDRARALLEAAAEKTVLVVGDLMLDRYIYGGVERISPEAPVPVVQVRHEKHVPGGAANVAWNVRSLGGNAAVAGILGQDEPGDVLKRLLGAEDVHLMGIEETSRLHTTVKMRIVADRQQVVRVDWDSHHDYNPDVVARFCDRVSEAIEEADAVILEDYGKGVIRPEVISSVLTASARAGVPVGFDPKDTHDLEIGGLAVASPNRMEVFTAAGLPDLTPGRPPLEDDRLQEAGRILAGRWGTDMLMMTLGPQGMLLLEQGRDPVHVPTRAREVFDVSGAGDTVIGTCMLAIAAGASRREAAELANVAAGVVVGKLGTAACTVEELLGELA